MQPLLFLFEFIFTCWIGHVFSLCRYTALAMCTLTMQKVRLATVHVENVWCVRNTQYRWKWSLFPWKYRPMFSLACEQWIGLFRLQNRFIICFSVSTRFLWLVLDCRNIQLFFLPKSLLSLFELTNCRALIDNVLNFEVRTQDS